ncbi:MAG: DUF1549 domain-containing protein [Armatimonadota bacterium]
MRWLVALAGASLCFAPLALAAPAKSRTAKPRTTARKPAAKRPTARPPAGKTPSATKKPPAPPKPVVKAPEHPQFLRHVAPILDKQGCSVAACHGKFGGRGDFQLSLLTLAPEDDYAPIVYGARGRRVNLQEPEQSLFLLKAINAVPHGGGPRFRKDSLEYQTLLNWLKDGAPFREEDPRLQELTVTPAQQVLKAGSKARLKVLARWSDGQVEDVTKQAIYTSSDEPVATVDGAGVITGVRWGGTAVQVRYLGVARAGFVTLPQERKGAGNYPEGPRANFIDEYVFTNLKRMNVLPSPTSSDEQFCRRVYLDTLGVLPTPEELEQFVHSADPRKRAKLIDALLERPEFVDLRTLRLADMLRLNPRKINNNGAVGQRSVVLFHEWIRENVAKNRPWDQLVKELLAARGSLLYNGPASYWAIERTANDRAETTGQAFLGVRLQCARCHKHPFDRWTTDDYWNFSAFHGKIGLRNVPGGAFAEQEVFYNAGARVVNESVNGPRRGLPAEPTFLGAKPLTEEELKEDISLKLADWVTSPENPFFARATMNRLWSQFFGRALIHPVDDMRETTPESVPGLLDALAKELVSHQYDLKHMIRLILNSRTYQLSSEPNESNTLDDRFHARYYPKPMLAQVMLDALNQATGVTERLTAFPLTRTVELPLPANNFFLDVFGQSHREYLTELDPKLEPNLVQTLHMMNSGYVNGKIRGGTAARELARDKMADAELIRRAFLRTVCRPPTAREVEAAMAALAKTEKRQEWVEDLMWALLSSREFLFIS